MDGKSLEMFGSALELVIHCCKQVHTEPRLVFFSFSDSSFVNIDLPSWLQRIHSANKAIRQQGSAINRDILQKNKELYRRFYLCKAHIHHAISLIEKALQSPEMQKTQEELQKGSSQGEGNLSSLEHMEMSLASVLESLLRLMRTEVPGVQHAEDKEEESDEEEEVGIGEEEDVEAEACASDFAGLPEVVERKTAGWQVFLFDCWRGSWNYWRGIPRDAVRLFRRSPLAAILMLVFLPFTMFVYLIGGVYEVMQWRTMRRFYAIQERLHEIYEASGSVLEEPQSRALIEEFFRLLCQLGGRSYDYQFRSSLRSLPWKAVEYYLRRAEGVVTKGDNACVDEAKLLRESFYDLRLEARQVYAGDFDDFCLEVVMCGASMTSVIEYRQDLIMDHLNSFQSVLSQFATQLKLELQSQQEEREVEEEGSYDDVRHSLMMEALEWSLEQGWLKKDVDFKQACLTDTVGTLQVIAALCEIKKPRLKLKQCPKDATHIKLIDQIRQAHNILKNLSDEEVVVVAERSLNPHLIVGQLFPHRIEILRLSEKYIPSVSRRIFNYPPFDYHAFLQQIPGDLVEPDENEE